MADVETQIPWAPGANFATLICKLGELRSDGADSDENPDLMTSSGTVTLTPSVKRIRYTEADGGTRMLTMKPQSFKIRKSDGVLYDTASGINGVQVLLGSSAGLDPSGFTWTAVVTPDNGGEAFTCVIPANATSPFDLVKNAGIGTANAGTSSLETRILALETEGVGGGGSAFIPSLDNALSGSRFTCLWNGSNAWQYNGVNLNARPTSRSDIFFDLVGAPSTITDPIWAQLGDRRYDV